MSYADPIDTAIVQEVLDDLEDNNAHTLCELLAASYGLPWSVPAIVADKAYIAAQGVLEEYRLEERNKTHEHYEMLSKAVSQ